MSEPPVPLTYAQPGTVQYLDPNRPSAKATAALVCGFLGFLHFGAGICAIIIGRRELAAIDAGLSSPLGRGRARAGMVLGIVGLVFCVVFIVLRVVAQIASEVLRNPRFG